ncbi:hypothetical protein SBOR_2483 [Sclerotinia borealis F-4128]|uniref:Uncharacterized protein n=1 Tax=Sclerotinia borealis (strain F-4128) TaxID=1432307 RepID=W9CRK6_SCLBF|nr:hypothetical protein SBOR_2483 [Sclerotinia borealis F-4128]
MVKSIAVRWEIGQGIEDDWYDTICGPRVAVDRLLQMMCERGWRDRLVVVYDALEGGDGVGVGSELRDREGSPILGELNEEE